MINPIKIYILYYLSLPIKKLISFIKRQDKSIEKVKHYLKFFYFAKTLISLLENGRKSNRRVRKSSRDKRGSSEATVIIAIKIAHPF